MGFFTSTLRPHGRDRARNVEDGMSDSTLQFPPGPPPHGSRRATMVVPDFGNQLSTFRHMVGIHSIKGFAPQTSNPKSSHMPDFSHNNLHFDGRAAPNLGMYNRVCHREKEAKRGYKFASALINSCLGLQVIIAAALTAMGAANTNHVSITAFGAINTVLAAILTYLKGSGLPNRIRWYENEWKKVREYIEQRERDFTRPDCRLDVNEVVGVIEAMYEEVKADIQTNTPESYISVSDIRARSAAATNPQIPKLQNLIGGTGEKSRSKFEELELKYGHKVTDFLEGMAHKEEERLKKLEGDVESSKARALAALQDEKDHAVRGARDWEKDIEDKGARIAEREIDHARSSVLQRGFGFAQDLNTAKAGILQRGNSLSRDFEVTKNAALQRGRDYEKDMEAKAARLAEMERDLEREAEQARDAAQKAGDSIQRAGDSLQRTGDSIQRIGKAVDDEIQPIRRE